MKTFINLANHLKSWEQQEGLTHSKKQRRKFMISGLFAHSNNVCAIWI